MRNVYLVGLREFLENVRTKGFWLGMLVVPILITASASVGRLLERSKPTRNFVLVDPAGTFETAVARALDSIHQRAVVEALGAYLTEHGDPQKLRELGEQNATLSAGVERDLAARFSQGDEELVRAFLQPGAVEAMLASLRGALSPDAPPFEEPRRSFRRVELPTGIRADDDVANIVEALKPYLRGESKIQVDGEEGDLFAAILVPADVRSAMPEQGAASGADVQYWSINLADDNLSDAVEDAFNEEVRRRAFEDRGLAGAEVRAIQRYSVPFVELDPAKEAGEERVGMADKLLQWAPVGFVYFLWLAIFSIAQMLLNNMIEEKSNRLIEVLLSSVTPNQLMLGKLLGIAAVGLTMITAWVAYMIGFLEYKSDAEWAFELLRVLKTAGLVPLFLLYFVLGYLLYATVFLTIGSLCNTLKEAQNLMMPIIVVMIVPLITMEFIPREPNGTVARVLSWIPIYTPFVMMNRAAANPPLVDRIGTLVLLITTTVLVMALCGRIFRIGILRTGQPPKLFEILRWVRSA